MQLWRSTLSYGSHGFGYVNLVKKVGDERILRQEERNEEDIAAYSVAYTRQSKKGLHMDLLMKEEVMALSQESVLRK